jgi:glutamate-1-semialdehyde 2,1-aminomutase
VTTGVVTHAGTFNGNAVAAAAVLASLDELETGDVYSRIDEVGGALMTAIAQRAVAHGLDLHIQGLPMAFHASFRSSREPIRSCHQLQSTDQDEYGRLALSLIDNGIWVAYRGIWYVSAAHNQQDVSETVERIDSAFAAFQKTL